MDGDRILVLNVGALACGDSSGAVIAETAIIAQSDDRSGGS